MRKAITSVLVAAGFFLSTYLTSTAMAGNFSVGIMGAGATFDTSGVEKEGSAPQESIAGSSSADVFYGTVYAEYSVGEMYGMTMGVSFTPINSVLGTRKRTDATSDATEDSQDDGTYTAKAKVSDQATIYLEPTYMPSENFGVYLKGGVARVVVKSLEQIAIGEDSSSYGNETVFGPMFGFGVKGMYDNGVTLKLELIRILYQTVKMTSATGNKNTIEADPEQLAVRLGIGYKF